MSATHQPGPHDCERLHSKLSAILRICQQINSERDLGMLLDGHPGNVWIGLEYFCYEGDALWRKSDAADVLDATVIPMPKHHKWPARSGECLGAEHTTRSGSSFRSKIEIAPPDRSLDLSVVLHTR
jgi:hypothetical protein